MSDVDNLVLDAFLDRVADQAERQGADCGPLLNTVRTRIALGSRVYGHGAWRERDNLSESHEEAADLIAYNLFEYLKDLEDPLETDGARAEHLVLGAVHAAIADWYTRAAGRGVDP